MPSFIMLPAVIRKQGSAYEPHSFWLNRDRIYTFSFRERSDTIYAPGGGSRTEAFQFVVDINLDEHGRNTVVNVIDTYEEYMTIFRDLLGAPCYSTAYGRELFIKSAPTLGQTMLDEHDKQHDTRTRL